jgi:hypothetical protein
VERICGGQLDDLGLRGWTGCQIILEIASLWIIVVGSVVLSVGLNTCTFVKWLGTFIAADAKSALIA